MAERINNLPERHRGKTTMYPYLLWFDGSIWKLKQGEDFNCSCRVMSSLLYNRAKALGYRVVIRLIDDGLAIQGTKEIGAKVELKPRFAKALKETIDKK